MNQLSLFCTQESQVPNRKFLARQKQLLKAKYPEARFICDIASGFNQNRRGYKTILESAIFGTPQHLVATTSNRITRTGLGLIKWLIELSGEKVELLEESDNSEQFDTKTLIAFITSAINSNEGKRSASRRNNKQKD